MLLYPCCPVCCCAGLVYRGSAARLRRVVRRLLHNEPVSIGVVGSSISYGKGVQRGTSDWFTLFSAWLQAAFPAAKVTARNGAVPLARSEFISACLEHHVDTNADLVFIEVSVFLEEGRGGQWGWCTMDTHTHLG